MKSRESKREAWLSLSPSLSLSTVWIRPKMRSFGRLNFCRLFIHETRASRRATCHVSFGPFSSRNNLFRPDFSFIYLKWKFFKYLIFFMIFLKISFLGSTRRPSPVAPNFMKIRLFRNSTKFDWVTRFHEMNSTMKSVSSSKI